MNKRLATPRLLDALNQATGAWVWDVAEDRLYADARFAALMSLDPAAAQHGLPTSAFFAAIHPDDRLRIRIAVAGILRGAETFGKDFRILDKDGTVRWVSGRGRGERDAAGALARFTGVLLDVTEQKRIEEQLRVAQTAGGVGTFEHVDGFGTVSVSDQFCRLLGLHPSDALPVRTVNAVVHPADPPIIRAPDAQQDQLSAYCELRIRRADSGEERWLARRGEYRTDGGGRGGRFIGVIYDITAAKTAEAQLRELARTLESRVEERTQERDRIWKRSRDLFLVLSRDGRYTAVNPAWTEVLGHSEETLLGRRRGDLLHPEDLEVGNAGFGQLLEGESLQNFDVRVRTVDGDYRWINWTVIPEGDVFYGMGRDVTERKELEDQLRQSQKMEAVGQLTGGLAHDFNNMLTGIIGGLDLAQRRMKAGRAEDAYRFMDAAIASAERAAALTHRLLAFSRRQSLDPQPVDIGALTASMEDLLRRTLGEGIELSVVHAPDLWRARADANQLESAILNLAINARDAMPDGGKLTIAAENLTLDQPRRQGRDELASGDYVVLSVRDTGAGIPESIRAKVFDPFFTTKPIGQGTGLGLSMIYGFVRQSGGSVAIDSEPGQGTTVKLYLPRLLQDAQAEALVQAADAKVAAGAGETVLVVEDDPQVRMLISSVLEDLGYAPLVAADGAEAFAVVEGGRKIDLLITDVGLPGLNGRQLAEMIRKLRPALPVLFVTGYAPAAAVRSEFLERGMRMISKPFAIDLLARTLREML